MKTINLNDGNVLLEITNKCYTGCQYCYKKLTVSPKGQHLDLVELKSRVDWIKKFTDASTIYLLGGESLLSPHFTEISEYIIRNGYSLRIITSGVISKLAHEVANYEYMIRQYRLGKISIELSYHTGRNQEVFLNTVQRLKGSFRVRRRNLKRANSLFRLQNDLHTTLVVSGNLDYSSLMAEVKKVCAVFDWETKEIEEKAKEYYDHHFVKKDQTLNAKITGSDSFRGFRASLTLMGEREIINNGGRVTIYMPPGQVCPSVNVELEEKQVKLDSLLVRHDGGLIFPTSQCIDMSGPLLNLKIHKDPGSVYDALTGSIKQMKAHVFKFNRLKAKENCGPDGVELACTACPFDKMCTPCWHTKRPWQK